MSRIRANTIVNGAGTGAPNFPRGAIISGISTITADINIGTGTSISNPVNNELVLGTNNVERVRINSVGSVGVGTDSPNFSDFGANTGGIEISNVNTNNALLVQSGTNEFYFANTSTVNYIWGDDNVPLSIATNDTERLRITSNGSVGTGGLIPTDGTFVVNSTIRSQNSSSNVSYMGFTQYTGDTSVGSMFSYIGGDGRSTGYLNFSTNDTERLRITSGGEVQIANGNLKFSTAGTGIDFSATSDGSGTTTSELLDDYEEGTWTPFFSTNTTGATGQAYDVQRGRYTKIGRIVECTFDVQLNTEGSFSGTYVTLGGFPFTNVEGGNVGGNLVTGYWSGFNLAATCSTITSYSDATNTYIMTPTESNGSTYLTVANASSVFTPTSRLIGSITLYLTS